MVFWRLGYIAVPAKRGQLSWFFWGAIAEGAGVEEKDMDEAWIWPIRHSNCPTDKTELKAAIQAFAN